MSFPEMTVFIRTAISDRVRAGTQMVPKLWQILWFRTPPEVRGCANRSTAHDEPAPPKKGCCRTI